MQQANDGLRHAIGTMVGKWSALLKYFPVDRTKAIAEYVELLISPRDAMRQLAWLNDQMINHVGEWKGALELRRIFCQRFAPHDSVEPDEAGQREGGAPWESGMLSAGESPALIEGGSVGCSVPAESEGIDREAVLPPWPEWRTKPKPQCATCKDAGVYYDLSERRTFACTCFAGRSQGVRALVAGGHAGLRAPESMEE